MPENTPASQGALAPAEQARLDRRLIAAAWSNDVTRAQMLIDAGADVNAKDASEQSAFLIATSEGYLRLLELTLRHGANVNSKDSFHGTGLIRAAERGHYAIVGRLVQVGTEVDHVNNLGWTALHEAIILGDGSQRYIDTVRVLVAAGAGVQLPSRRDGIAPIAHAEAKGYTAIAELLRVSLAADRRGALDPETADQQLLAAATVGDADLAAVALRHGATPEVRDQRRRTPLLIAVNKDRQPVARLLVALGGDPD